MHPVDVFGVGGGRQLSADLPEDAENGRVAAITKITKRGRPGIRAMPFDVRPLSLGVHRAPALRLLENRHLTMGPGGARAPYSASRACCSEPSLAERSLSWARCSRRCLGRVTGSSPDFAAVLEKARE